MATSQSQAETGDTNLIQYNISFENLIIHGKNDGTTQDTGIRLGATYGSYFKNVEFHNLYIGNEIYFCLQANFHNCKWGDNISIGCIVSDASWPGASTPNSCSNNVSFYDPKFRCAPNSLYGLRIHGSDGVNINNPVFEGSTSSTAPIHHIYATNPSSTIIKTLRVVNFHFEQACSRSNIMMESPGGQSYSIYLDTGFVQGVTGAFLELNTIVGGTLQARLNNIPDCSSGWKLRQSGTQSSWWIIDYARLAVKNNGYDPANWDTSTIAGTAGTIPLNGRVYLDPNVQYLN